jgi:peptide/nickel transport system substrate-binding protein
VFPGDWIGLDAADPSSYPPLRGNGKATWFGWPDSPRIEALREQWLAAADAQSQRAISADMQRQALTDVPFIPLGQYFSPTAFSRSLAGILTGSILFWNVHRA